MIFNAMCIVFYVAQNWKNADGWSGHGGGEAEGQWIIRQRVINGDYNSLEDPSKFKYRIQGPANCIFYICAYFEIVGMIYVFLYV